MKSYLPFFALSLALLPLTAYADQDNGAPTIKYPPGYTAITDNTYVRVGTWDGKMDLYLPPKQNGPTPAVIKIHGGGWNHGTKVSPGGVYFDMGFAVIDVEYRFTQVAPAPAAIEDTRCALKYVIDHAKELNIDASKIVLQGGSAGGHLSLITGLLGNDRRFDSNCPSTTNMQVAAIVDEYGPTDFTSQSWAVISTNKSVVSWIGSNAADETFKAAVSPLTYVSRQSPPILIIHGDQDHTVPLEQSIVLEDKLKGYSIPSTLILVKGAGHGKFTNQQSNDENREIQKFLESVRVTK
jgi:acetyl esterase/lipase